MQEKIIVMFAICER